MLEPRVVDDGLIDGLRLRTGQSMDGRVQKHVLAAGQLGMKPDAQLDHRADPRASRHEQLSAGWPMNRGNQFQERALARSVPSNQADGLSVVDLQRDVLQSPEL